MMTINNCILNKYLLRIYQWKESQTKKGNPLKVGKMESSMSNIRHEDQNIWKKSEFQKSQLVQVWWQKRSSNAKKIMFECSKEFFLTTARNIYYVENKVLIWMARCTNNFFKIEAVFFSKFQKANKLFFWPASTCEIGPFTGFCHLYVFFKFI